MDVDRAPGACTIEFMARRAGRYFVCITEPGSQVTAVGVATVT